MNENPGVTKYTEEYISWYDNGPCSHHSCKNKRYYLGGCNTPGYEGTEYNDQSVHQITMPSTPGEDPLS